MSNLMMFYQNFSAASEKVLVLYMRETIRKTRGKHGVFVAVMRDLSKAFDCISHDFLVAKLHAYRFDESSLKVIISYLKNRTQTTKAGSSFRELLNIIFGVPQGSILGSLLFIIYICHLFIVNKEVNFYSYADDTTPFITGMSFEQIIPELESILSDISQWFMNNNLKANAVKFYLFLSPYKNQRITVENYVIKSSGVEELLLVAIDRSHQRNLQQLAREIFKVKIGVAPVIMNEIFTFVKTNTYNLRSGMYLSRVNVHSTQYGTESIGNLGAKIWNLVPVHMKDLKALSTFNL